jgi:hypothetical protein
MPRGGNKLSTDKGILKKNVVCTYNEVSFSHEILNYAAWMDLENTVVSETSTLITTKKVLSCCKYSISLLLIRIHQKQKNLSHHHTGTCSCGPSQRT